MKPCNHLDCVDCHAAMVVGTWVHTAVCLHQQLDASHIHTCVLVGMSLPVHAFSHAFVVTLMILLHFCCMTLYVHFHTFMACACVQAEMPLCVCACVCTGLPKTAKDGWRGAC